ncbi:MAG: DUF4013 domain-containing protein [Candidatus Methylomirabilales bacterium]
MQPAEPTLATSLTLAREAFMQPFLDPASIRKLLTGAAANLMPPLGILAAGYTLRTLRAVLGGERRTLPNWDGLMDLILGGLKLFLVHAAYVGVPLLLQHLGVGPPLFLVVLSLAALLNPMAQVCFAEQDQLAAAFALPALVSRIRKDLRRYLHATAVWYGTIFLLVLLLQGTNPALAWFLLAFVGFYLSLVFAGLFGRIGAAGAQPLAKDPD